MSDNVQDHVEDPLVPAQSEEEFEVEKVIDRKETEHGVSYLIRWKGYGPDADTWEPLHALTQCKRAVAAFERQLKRKNAPKKTPTARRPPRSNSKSGSSSSKRAPKKDLPSNTGDDHLVEELASNYIYVSKDLVSKYFPDASSLHDKHIASQMKVGDEVYFRIHDGKNGQEFIIECSSIRESDELCKFFNRYFEKLMTIRQPNADALRVRGPLETMPCPQMGEEKKEPPPNSEKTNQERLDKSKRGYDDFELD